MEPLERVTVLLTLMKRLTQLMDHERALLRSMKLDDLGEIQEEKLILTEAYEIEFAKLRGDPEIFSSLDKPVRLEVEGSLRRFQNALASNRHALMAAQTVVEKILRNITDTVARQEGPQGYRRPGPSAERRGQVISVAFDQKL